MILELEKVWHWVTFTELLTRNNCWTDFGMKITQQELTCHETNQLVSLMLFSPFIFLWQKMATIFFSILCLIDFFSFTFLGKEKRKSWNILGMFYLLYIRYHSGESRLLLSPFSKKLYCAFCILAINHCFWQIALKESL